MLAFLYTIPKLSKPLIYSNKTFLLQSFFCLVRGDSVIINNNLEFLALI